MLRRLRAQSSLEYMVIVIIIVGAFIAMQAYIKRGIQGRWKSSLDDFGDQYDPRTSNSKMVYHLVSNSETVVESIPGRMGMVEGAYTNRVDTTHSIETKTGSINIGAEKN